MARSIAYGGKELHHITLQHIRIAPGQFLTALQRRVRAFAYPAGVAVAAKTGFKNRPDLLHQGVMYDAIPEGHRADAPRFRRDDAEMPVGTGAVGLGA
jgi:hypothetical protein